MRSITILLSVIFLFVLVTNFLPHISKVSAQSITAAPQSTPERALNNQDIVDLIDELKVGLPDFIDDEDAVAEIEDKWAAHEGLVGKTNSQVARLLFDDVRSVIDDKATLDAIWKKWNESDEEDQEEDNTSTAKPTTQSVTPRQQSAEEGDPLNEDEIDDLIGDLSDGLYDLLDDDDVIAIIVDKWIEREDLGGKTQSEALKLLFFDVRSVVTDKATQDEIWANWNENYGQGNNNDDDEAKKLVAEWLADAKKNEANYKAWFKIAKMETGFNPERVAGFCFKMLSKDLDDKGCWSMASFRGLVAFFHIEGDKTQDADLKRVTDFGKIVAACKPQDNCARLKADVVDKFEEFYFDDLAGQQRDKMSIMFKIIGTDNGYEPDKIGGFCLKQFNPPDGQLGVCDEFVKTAMFGYWKLFGTSTRTTDRARLSAFYDKTVRCRAPRNCVQILRDLKGAEIAGLPKAAADTPLDTDGYYDYKRVYASCMSGTSVNDANAKSACLTTTALGLAFWSITTGKLGPAHNDLRAKAVMERKKDEAKQWARSMTNLPAPK
ncbi:MAG TPA: hypothetical protein PLL77_05405 [Pyrinomonadaceae bacterium]|nr:hypothetical protein [Pyrinomonadaceae bacterium]